MDQDSTYMVVASKVPMLKPGEYEIWRMRIEQYIQMIDYALWEVIENGATLPKTTTIEGVVTVMPITTAEEKAQRRLESSKKSRQQEQGKLKKECAYGNIYFHSWVSSDGLGGYDWSDQVKDGLIKPHAFLSSSSPNSEVFNDSICSKSCLETVESLKSQNDQLLKDLKKSELMIQGYKTGLELVEEKLKVYKANESIYLQDIKGLKFEIHIGEITIRELRKKLEIVQKEKDGIQLNVDKFENMHPKNSLTNGVAERRNRKLIEAARTMLADSKLLTTFWAEAVNTACYVQNKMFSESVPNIVGSGPDWLFDIDALTRTMNYEPIVAGDFLYGKVEEEVYVCQPPGFEDLDFLDRVYKVEKALLQGKRRRRMAYYLQDKYVLIEILKKFGFTEVKTASTPMETQKPLLKDEDDEEVDIHMYRSMTGSLMYLTSSRPDIHVMQVCCARFQVNPKVSHLL
ncbi:putative reverse transcriptase domain-containing protein [Tanacetum coccineum]